MRNLEEDRKDNLETDRQETDHPETDAPANGGGAGTEALSADPEALREMLEQEREELAECRGRVLRLQADFDNFRRRTRDEKEKWFRLAAGDVVHALLPVLDNFDRALATTGGNLENFAAGVRMIHQQLEEVLAAQGLEAMTTEGAEFDPECHDCVERVESAETPDNLVVGEIQRGYYFKGKVLRPALVRVNKHAE